MPLPHRTRKGRRFPPEVLTANEVERLIDALPVTLAGACHQTLIVLLYRTGVRISEALALQLHDLDAEAGTVLMRRGKGGRSRTVGMDAAGFRVVTAWLRRRRALGVPDTAPLFCAPSHAPVRANCFRTALHRVARSAGVRKRVHPHGFRHTHAAELRAEGVEIGVISKQLGHTSIATTARYVDHLLPSDVIDTIGRRRWDGHAA